MSEMPRSGSKGLIAFYILSILRSRTDAEHRLSQREIANALERDYGMKVDRKTVSENLSKLMELGYDIRYTEKTRTPRSKDGQAHKQVMITDLYLVPEFSEGELRLLIDSILFSHFIPSDQCEDLIDKLAGLSSRYFDAHVKHIAKAPINNTDSLDLFDTIEKLDSAITAERKVRFKYTEYGTDKRQHPRRCEDGTERVYLVSPYQMAAREDRYYLICNHDKYDDIANYRIDRIRDIEITDEPVKPFAQLKWANGRMLDLSTYMREHPYMYSSDNVRARLRITRPMISDVIDTFGIDVSFSDESDDWVTVTVRASELAVCHFATRFAPAVVVESPQRLRETIRANLERGLRSYE